MRAGATRRTRGNGSRRAWPRLVAARARFSWSQPHRIAQADAPHECRRSVANHRPAPDTCMNKAKEAGNHALPILMYHNIAHAPADLRGQRQGRVVVITLDDGYVDNLDAALPVLQKFGFSATTYVVSGSIGRFNEWDAERLGVRKPLMSAAELRRWNDAGMEIGAHTRTHPRLTGCNDAALREEIHGCKKDLEDRLGSAVTQFCYPYGDADDRVATVVREAGYEAATTTRRGRAVAGADLWRLPRVQIARHHLLPQFAARVLTRYEDRRA